MSFTDFNVDFEFYCSLSTTYSIQKSRSILLAKIHLKPGYLNLGYKEDLQELLVEWSNPTRPTPRPINNERTFIGLQDHRSSELALDHEKSRAIKKKTKVVKQINMQHLSFWTGLLKDVLR